MTLAQEMPSSIMAMQQSRTASSAALLDRYCRVVGACRVLGNITIDLMHIPSIQTWAELLFKNHPMTAHAETTKTTHDMGFGTPPDTPWLVSQC